METALSDSQNRSLPSLNSVIAGLIFFFPLFAVSMKSWTSAFHLFLCISSVVWLMRNNQLTKGKITIWEKLFMLLLLASFLWYVLSEYMNGWQSVRPHWPLIDLRYVLIIPLLLVFMQMRETSQWLLKGLTLGCISAAIFTLYQSFILNAAPPMGAYHHLFLGPATAAMSLIILYSKPWNLEQNIWRGLSYIGIACGALVLVLSTARSGFLATFILLLLYPVLTGSISLRKLFTFGVMLSVGALTTYYLFQPVRVEVNDTFQGIQDHLQQRLLSQENFHKTTLDNITIRFELWRVAYEISRNNLLFGVGGSGYSRLMHDMVDKGEAHPEVRSIVQPHNAYLYHLVTRGVVGLILFLGILFVPLIIFARHWKSAQTQAMLGVVWVLFFSIVSLTQFSVFGRGHYLSFYLVILAVLLASCMNAGHEQNKTAA
jgi:O-antigen ligase